LVLRRALASITQRSCSTGLVVGEPAWPPLRIAVSSYYLPSESKIGAGWMAHRLANALVARGHDVTVFSPCVRPTDALYHHTHVPLSGSLRTMRWPIAVRRLPLDGFDVLHAHGDDHLVPRAAVRAHVRTLHGSCFDEAAHAGNLKDRLRMAVLGVTEAIAAIRVPEVVGVSHNSIRFYPWLHTVIPNGVDTDLFSPGDTAKEAEPTILFVGTYRRRKRGAFLQRVFLEHIRPRVPDARLWMVCDDAPPAPGVEVLGRLTDEELADRYRRAWVFCLPSTYEGFGVPYVEAMLSGTPVVASPNRGAREVLEGGAAGVIAPDRRLGRALVGLLLDDAARASLRAAGLARTSRYALTSVVEQYEALYFRQLDGPHPRGRGEALGHAGLQPPLLGGSDVRDGTGTSRR